MLKKAISLFLSTVIFLSAIPVVLSAVTENTASPKMLYIKTDTPENLMQRVEVETGKTYCLTFGLSSSIENFNVVCYTDGRRYSIDANTQLISKQDNGLSSVYTYSYTIPETSENGNAVTDLVFFGIKFSEYAEGYIFDTSVYGAEDQNKTELLYNSDFSMGLDEWAWGWEAWFAYWEESGLTEWSDSSTIFRIVDYDIASLYENEDDAMLHVRYESAEMTDDILVQRVEALEADIEYTVSYNYHFESGAFGNAVHFVLLGDDGDSGTLRSVVLNFNSGSDYIVSSSDDGFKTLYKFKLSSIVEKYESIYIGFYFDTSPRMITEFYLSNLRLYKSEGIRKNLLTKKNCDDMQGWYSHWTEAPEGSKSFGSSSVSYLEYLAWYEPCDKRLFTPEIDAVHFGDVNYDANIDIRDLVAIKKKCAALDAYIQNFDANNDGTVNAQDLLTVRRHILGIEDISWNDAGSALQAAARVTGGAEKEATTLRTKIADVEDTLLKNSTSTVYYISEKGNYNNSGLSADQPITFEKLRNITLKSGDTVLFKRDDIFRIGTCYSLESGVSYGAYGAGEKPVISGSLRDYADKDIWITDDGFLWKTTVNADFAANIVFNNGEYVGIPKMTLEEANDDGEFYFDSENKTCYLYLRQRNPGIFFNSIEISSTDTLFIAWSNRKNMILENLALKYAAKHGINMIFCENVRITGCELSWIGGAFTGTSGGRYGNGIQFWCKAVNCDISNNYLYQIYDAALTFQGNNYGIYDDISNKNNLIEYSSMNFEFWGDYTEIEDLIISNINFTDNILRFAGYNFGGMQRNDEHNQAYVLGWYGDYDESQINNFNITDNIFDIANCNFYYAYDFTHMLNITDNTYFQDSNSDYCININENTYASSLESFKKSIELIDSNPTVYWQPEF